MVHFIPCAILFLILALSPIKWASAQVTTFQTIFEGAAFSAQDTCAQNCFTHYLAGCYMDNLGYSLQCPISPNACTTNWGAPNSCYCRSDKQSVALSLLSTCINSACTVGDASVDISTAQSIYTAYCIAAVGPLPTALASTTQPTLQATTTVVSSSTHTSSPGNGDQVISASTLSPSTSVPPTSTNSGPTSSSSSAMSTTSGQSNSDSFWTKAGGIVSIVAIIVTGILGIIAVVYAIKQYLLMLENRA